MIVAAIDAHFSSCPPARRRRMWRRRSTSREMMSMPESWRASMSKTREQAERHGRTAETIALWYLRCKGYRLLTQRFKSPMGEVDLIMRKGETTVFVEVKARPSWMKQYCGDALAVEADCASCVTMDGARPESSTRGFAGLTSSPCPLSLWPTHIENAFYGDR